MATNEPQLLQYREDGTVTVAAITNTTMLDGRTVEVFGRQALDYVKTRTGLNLLLDFTGVDYLSSAALTELIRINDAVVAGGGSVRICGLTPQIQKVFEITRFDKSFDIHPGENAARAAARFNRAVAVSKQEDAWNKRAGS